MQAQDIYKGFFLKNNVVAHRGAWKNTKTPQNSVASVKEAIRLGCAGVEIDVRMTSDGVLVLCHDDDHFGTHVDTHTYAELVITKLPNGENIPTLDAVLMELQKQSYTRLFLEIKPLSTKEKTIKSVEKIVQMVNSMGAVPWVYYISFDYDAMKKVRELSPAVPVAFLGGSKSPEELAADKIGADYHQNEFGKKPDFIEKAKKLGVSVCAWTVNSGEDMDNLIKQEVDYITTDEPELLLSKNAQTCTSGAKK
jgi:glycerophosphoryl diester phosphodiesterase